MEKQTIPYRRMIFVCTNVRKDGRVACANPGRGGDEVCEKLKAAIKAEGLKGKVRVARSGCLDLCEQGPNVVVFPDNVWHRGVSSQDVPELVKRYLV